MTDISNAYENYSKLRREAATFNRTIVFDALSAAQITSVTVTFDGEGDSGQIEGIAAYAGDDAREIPLVRLDIHTASWGKDTIDRTSVLLSDVIEQLCYDLLWQEHDGWEINDGSFGEFTFDVASRRIELTFNARFADFVRHVHTF
jgi:hypothetical protein